MHALFLAAGVDGDDADVRHHDDANDQVVLLQHRLGHHGNQVQGLLLGALQLHHHHQQVGPGEDRAEDDTQLMLLLLELQQVAAQHTTHTTTVWKAFVLSVNHLYINKVHLLCIIYNILGSKLEFHEHIKSSTRGNAEQTHHSMMLLCARMTEVSMSMGWYLIPLSSMASSRAPTTNRASCLSVQEETQKHDDAAGGDGRRRERGRRVN